MQRLVLNGMRIGVYCPHPQEQQTEGETGEAGSSSQEGQPNQGQQRELQLDMQTTEGQMEECVAKHLAAKFCLTERL